jgi:hypothetical protein
MHRNKLLAMTVRKARETGFLDLPTTVAAAKNMADQLGRSVS